MPLGDFVTIHEFIVSLKEGKIFERLFDSLANRLGVRAVFDFSDEVVLLSIRMGDFENDDVGVTGTSLELVISEVVIRDIEAGGVHFFGPRQPIWVTI